MPLETMAFSSSNKRKASSIEKANKPSIKAPKTIKCVKAKLSLNSFPRKRRLKNFWHAFLLGLSGTIWIKFASSTEVLLISEALLRMAADFTVRQSTCLAVRSCRAL